MLAVTIPNRYAKTPTNKEVNQAKQEEESPFDILALDDVRDIADLRKNITRQFTTSIMRGEDTNKLIEVFGNYWHPKEHEYLYLNSCKENNYELLILWEDEIYNNLDECILKIKKFIK